MPRVKWMRLVVRDLADVLRWADSQQARRIDQFRYRLIRGCEVVSFRLVPDYPIDIGPREIAVVALARGSWRQVALRRARAALRAIFARSSGRAAMATPSPPLRTAGLCRLPYAR